MLSMTADDAKSIGYVWTYTENNEVSGIQLGMNDKAMPISKSNGSITIPDIIDGQKVIEIGKNAFAEGIIDGVVLPETIILIKGNAFKDCKKIKQIYLPKGLKLVKKSAFQNCSKLSNVVFEDKDTVIENGAFSICYSLTNIELPKNLKRIPRSCFFRSRSLESIRIPEQVQIIESYAFQECSSLKEVWLPSFLINIEQAAFDKTHEGCQIYYDETQAKFADIIKSQYKTVNTVFHPLECDVF